LLELSDALKRAGHAVHYVADRADRYCDLGITCLVDQSADCGPLAGLSRALQHRAEQFSGQLSEQLSEQLAECRAEQLASAADREFPSGWLLLVSCDQSRWEAQWSAQLSSAASSVAGASAAAYYDTAWQPLPSLMHIDLLPDVQQRLRAGRLSLQRLLSDWEARGRCAKLVVSRSPSAWSFNTPEELARLSRLPER
jgi:molybdopterin-guanine dinucleotide biosynthesis protein A